MYFEIEDYRPDITPVGRAISWREGVLLSIIFHLCLVIAILLFPRWFPGLFQPNERAPPAAAAQSDARVRWAGTAGGAPRSAPLRVRRASQRHRGAQGAPAG